MDFAQQQRNPVRHLTGIGFVVLLHALVIYALVTGLARKVVEVIKQPIETKIIEEVKPPPPPDTPPPPPKLVTPPPPFIPPPEVQIQQPAVTNAITAVTNVKPEHPVAVRPPPPAPAPRPTSVAVACPNVRSVASQIEYPSRAKRAGIEHGEVALQFVVGPNGEIKNTTITSSTNRMFNDAALEAAAMLKCAGQGRDVTVSWGVVFKLAD